MINQITEFVGIDVGKDELAIHFLSANISKVIENSQETIQALADDILAMDCKAYVVLETTGGYERLAWRLLHKAGICVRQICAKKARHFARASGQLHKTDKADAHILACYAQHFPDDGRSYAGEAVEKLSELVLKRRSLVKDRKTVLTRIKRTRDPRLKELEDQQKAMLDEQIKTIEKLIEQDISEDAEFKKRSGLLQSIPGIGPVVSSLIVARMPELGSVTPEQAAALVGVAPFARDSGAREGKRMISGGKREVREALYQAALMARICNPAIEPLATRLKDKGKPHKKILIASARKLIIIANAVLKRGNPFEMELS